MECSGYVVGDFEGQELCRCPICKGWLPRTFPMDKPFICKKCGAELMTFPDKDMLTGEDSYGKICAIGGVTP